VKVPPTVVQPTILGATIVFIPPLHPSSGPNGVAINDAGQVAGYTNVASGEMHAFRWTPGGTTEDLGTLGGTFSRAEAINASGQVVGHSALPIVDSHSRTHAFLWTPGAGMRDLGILGSDEFIAAYGINDAGHVVGSGTTSPTAQHAFLWTPTAGMRDLGTLGGPSSRAYAISNAGHVVGRSATANGDDHAFLWTPQLGMQDLGTLGGSYSQASSVNDAGYVVGVSKTASGAEHAFLWKPGVGMQDLGTLGSTYSNAYSINEAGWIVGDSRTPSGSDRGFLWTATFGMEDLYPATGMLLARAINNRGQVVAGNRVATLQLPNQAPVANPGGPYTGAKKKPVMFDGTRSTDPDGDVLTYEWNFGDGSPSAGGATATHEYETWGTYIVTLTVRDPAGLSSAATSSVLIAPPGHVKARP
jgi:probable HAF family extracellular repeat protein